MAIDKGKLIAKIKEMTPEERGLFREAMQEAEPGEGLSMEEVSKVREMLTGTGPKKEKKKAK